MEETRESLIEQKKYTEGVIDGLRLSTAWIDKNWKSEWSKKEDEYMRRLAEIERKIDESIEEEYQDYMAKEKASQLGPPCYIQGLKNITELKTILIGNVKWKIAGDVSVPEDEVWFIDCNGQKQIIKIEVI